MFFYWANKYEESVQLLKLGLEYNVIDYSFNE